MQPTAQAVGTLEALRAPKGRKSSSHAHPGPCGLDSPLQELFVRPVLRTSNLIHSSWNVAIFNSNRSDRETLYFCHKLKCVTNVCRCTNVTFSAAFDV